MFPRSSYAPRFFGFGRRCPPRLTPAPFCTQSWAEARGGRGAGSFPPQAFTKRYPTKGCGSTVPNVQLQKNPLMPAIRRDQFCAKVSLALILCPVLDAEHASLSRLIPSTPTGFPRSFAWVWFLPDWTGRTSVRSFFLCYQSGAISSGPLARLEFTAGSTRWKVSAPSGSAVIRRAAPLPASPSHIGQSRGSRITGTR